MSDKRKDTVIPLKQLRISATAPPSTVWQSDNYAEDWYRDAMAEVCSGGNYNARRREIIFATCFAESFIFEWARGKLQVEEINDYFPPERRCQHDTRYHRNLLKKWKEVPTDLYRDKRIKLLPKLHLSRLGKLLQYRHGLIHASASRPATKTQAQKTKPFPAKKDLKKLKAGWAVSIVFDLVSELCHQLGEPKQEYLQKP